MHVCAISYISSWGAEHTRVRLSQRHDHKSDDTITKSIINSALFVYHQRTTTFTLEYFIL